MDSGRDVDPTINKWKNEPFIILGIYLFAFDCPLWMAYTCYLRTHKYNNKK